jgi:sugar phosphate isomerase/epimerase
MKTSTEIGSSRKIVGEEKAIEYVAKAGFDAWDFSMCNMINYDWGKDIATIADIEVNGKDYVKHAKKLKQIGLDNGIVCNQSHAPFPVYNKVIRDTLKRSIECTAIAGGEICIVHPDNYKSAEENAEMYFELLPFAKAHGVKIATENMWNWKGDFACPAACSSPEDFKKHVDIIGDPYLVACVDIGHAEMKGLNTSAVELIKALGHRVQALHIHDNDKVFDSHQIPFSMNIDFNPIVKTLKEIDYKGYFTLECDYYIPNDADEETVKKKLKDLSNAARKLANYFDNL